MNKMMNTLKYIIPLVIIFVIVYIILTKKKIFNSESFIVTVNEYVLGKQCPDYCAYDGHNYYLIFNNKEFDGINNPLIFETEAEVKAKCNKLNCPVEHYLQNMIILNRKTNHDDPQEDLERKCAKQIALNSFSIDKCAFDFAYSTPEIADTITSPNNNLSKTSSNNLLNLEGEIKNMSDATKQKKALDNYKMIRQLVDFINQNDESVMVDYDLETCMFEKVGDLFNGQSGNNVPLHLKKQDLGTKTNLHKFRKHFNNSGKNLKDSKGVDFTGNEESTYLDEDSMKGFIDYFNKSNNVIEDNVITKIFSNDNKFERV